MNSRLLVASIALTSATHVWAEAAGRAGTSGVSPVLTCALCHTPGAPVPTVTLAGPQTLAPGETQKYTLTVSGGPGVNAGLDVAVQGGGELVADPESTTTKLLRNEIVNSVAAPMTGGSAAFTFLLKAPATPGTVTLYAAGLSGDGKADAPGDSEALIQLPITVQGTPGAPLPAPVDPPRVTLVQGAVASENPVRKPAATLAIVVDGGNRPLRYVWTAVGPDKVTFSRNADDESYSTDVTFNSSGLYKFTCNVKDENGIVATSKVDVTVELDQGALTATDGKPAASTVQVAGGCGVATSQRTAAASMSLLSVAALFLTSLRKRKQR